MRNLARVIGICCVLCVLGAYVGVSLRSGTRVRTFHTYANTRDHLRHYSFQLTHFVSGVHMGPCGIGIGGFDWSYWIDLAGDSGPYSPDRISLAPQDGGPIVVAGGTVSVDERSGTMDIRLTTLRDGKSQPFEGNGVHKFQVTQ